MYIFIQYVVYLIIGIMFVMLLVSVISQIPQLNLSKYFILDNSEDPEKQLLTESIVNSGSYTQQINEPNTSDTSPIVQD